MVPAWIPAFAGMTRQTERAHPNLLGRLRDWIK